VSQLAGILQGNKEPFNLIEIIQEYKESLRSLRESKTAPLYRSSMISDTEWAIRYMETGQIPGTKWAVARWRREDREVLFDPQVLDKCFRGPKAAQKVSEDVKNRLNELLSCLSEKEKEAFLLVHGEKMTHAQAAEYMGLSRGNIYNLLRRAEKKFFSLRDLAGQKQFKGKEAQ
jgi:RNA polymerase sigma-70 factor (ECF subfamily)